MWISPGTVRTLWAADSETSSQPLKIREVWNSNIYLCYNPIPSFLSSDGFLLVTKWLFCFWPFSVHFFCSCPLSKQEMHSVWPDSGSGAHCTVHVVTDGAVDCAWHSCHSRVFLLSLRHAFLFSTLPQCPPFPPPICAYIILFTLETWGQAFCFTHFPSLSSLPYAAQVIFTARQRTLFRSPTELYPTE